MRNKVHVYYASISGQDLLDIYDMLMKNFPDSIKEKINRYKSQHERNQRIAGKALLEKALGDLGLNASISLNDYKYTPSHHPYLQGSDLNFSLSHTDELVICVVARGMKVGVDAEKQYPVMLNTMKFYFSPDAWQKISNAPNPDLEFYRQWTMREAAVKASGLSMEHPEFVQIRPLNNVIVLDGQPYYCKQVELEPDYCVCLASELQDFEIAYHRCDLLQPA
ncbi:MAG: 4'-phosphopantetheinyl transferase superfamily protein [Edaphocola sp.]